MPRRTAPGSLAVGTEASVWTEWAATHAPAPQGSLENTVRGISMNACPGPATPPAAWTVCSWTMITSVAVALDLQVNTC